MSGAKGGVGVEADAADAVPIPLHRPVLGEPELRHLLAVVERGHIGGAGAYGARVEQLLGAELAGCRALLTTSGTHALELAALLLGVGPGDEVIVPTFTFPSTANAFMLRGARVAFADIRRDTLNLDEAALEQRISPRTRVIVPVHYAGVPCAMDGLTALADRHGIAIVEDNAHGLFGAFRGRPLGTWGRFGALSFHESKNVTCGEGGALICSDPDDAARAEVLREKGTDRAAFVAGEVDRYTWHEVGSSYCPSDLLAAVLLGQLEQREQIQARRRSIWETYQRELAGWAADRGVALPVVPEGCEPAYHLFFVVVPQQSDTERFIAHLRSLEVAAAWHFQPLHASPAGRRADPGASCPVADELAPRVVRIPLSPGLADHEVERVIEAITTWPASR